MRLLLSSVWAQSLLVAPIFALKVQLNPSSVTARSVEGYEIWPVTNGDVSSSTTFDEVSLKLEAMGDALNGNRNKIVQARVTGYLGEFLVGAGLSSNTRDASVALQLSISGLEEGSHSLLTWHNAWDALNSTSPIDVAINDQIVLRSSPQTVRSDNIWTAASTYLVFNVSSPSDTTVFTFTPSGDSTSSDKRAYINALEIDTPDINTQPSFPEPPNGEEHILADDHSFTLRFKAATNAASYNLYISTTSAATVENATTSSNVFVGSLSDPSYDMSDISSLEIYWWRVDAVYNDGSIVPGRVWSFRSRMLAFPGADGYGRYARGGRGGAIAKVTNLEDYDPSSENVIEGSFRWAVSALTGPRTVIFDVGGVITLKARVTITEKYITVAGQTAPGKGIVLQAFPVGLSGTSDVIIRHLRVRPGKLSNETIDGMGMRGSNHCIFDHCSISWTIDESFSSRDAYNITLQRTLISEPLNVAGHQNYPEGTQHGFAGSIGGNTGTFHHNLIAHAEGRSWSMAGGLDNAANFNGQLSIVNNVVYNFGDRATDGGAREVDFINNYYQTGAATAIFYSFKAQYEDSFPGRQQYYCSGNVMPGVFDENTPQVFNSTSSSGVGPCFAWVTIDPAPTYQYFLDQPFFPNSVDIQPAKEARKRVLSDVGANVPVLDDHDKRIINETITNTTTYVGSYTGKAGIIDDPADVGGLENYPEAVRAVWDVDSDHDGIPDWWDGSNGGEVGWTPLDGYLNWMAEPHVFVALGGTTNFSLEDLARGFVNPTFTIKARKGSVTSTNTVATYMAPRDAGIDVLTLHIMDEDGTVWSRNVGVAVMAGYQ